MSKKRSRRKEPSARASRGADPVSNPDSPIPVAVNESAAGWSKLSRRIASAVILLYLIVLLIGPLSNPVASPYLSGPVAAVVSPIHRMLFLGHGYRFFGPDPGPSHLLVYKGKRSDGTSFEGKFPDRDSNWPRLLYHRWFMLSETVFSEYSSLPSQQQFRDRLKNYEQQIGDCQRSGQMKLAGELQKERDIETEQYEISRQRAEVLGEAIAEELLKRNNGESIELFVQVRQIPLAEEVASGIKLSDASLLSELLPIGVRDSEGFRIPAPVDVSQPEVIDSVEVKQ